MDGKKWFSAPQYLRLLWLHAHPWSMFHAFFFIFFGHSLISQFKNHFVKNLIDSLMNEPYQLLGTRGSFHPNMFATIPILSLAAHKSGKLPEFLHLLFNQTDGSSFHHNIVVTAPPDTNFMCRPYRALWGRLHRSMFRSSKSYPIHYTNQTTLISEFLLPISCISLLFLITFPYVFMMRHRLLTSPFVFFFAVIIFLSIATHYCKFSR